VSERAVAIIDKNHIQKEALWPHQWWEKSESGKRWELWTNVEKGMLRRLTYINRKNVLWVIPAKEEDSPETREVPL
jgi:hypothetical protein